MTGAPWVRDLAPFAPPRPPRPLGTKGEEALPVGHVWGGWGLERSQSTTYLLVFCGSSQGVNFPPSGKRYFLLSPSYGCSVCALN